MDYQLVLNRFAIKVVNLIIHACKVKIYKETIVSLLGDRSAIKLSSLFDPLYFDTQVTIVLLVTTFSNMISF